MKRREPNKVVLAAIKKSDLTARQVREVTGLDKGAVSRRLKFLHGMGVIHISTYIAINCGNQAAVYRYGDGKDAKPLFERTVRQKQEPAEVQEDEPAFVPFVELPMWHNAIFGRAEQQNRREA